MPDKDISISQVSAVPTYIRQIVVEKLFGYLTYQIPPEESVPSGMSRLIILYGDNGCGKTTLLKLLFSLLCPYEHTGEKTFLAHTPFRRFAVFFDNGVSVSVEKSRLVGSYRVNFHYPDRPAQTCELKSSAGSGIREQTSYRTLLNRLSQLSFSLYFLPDDRRVRKAPIVSGGADESAIHHRDDTEEDFMLEESDELNRELMRARGHTVEFRREHESHHLDIGPVLNEISTWFRRHAFQGTNTGEENATSIYLSIVEQIARSANSGVSPTVAEDSTKAALIDRLHALGTQMASFTRFGLIAPIPVERFVSVLQNANDPARDTVSKVLQPFVEGVEARLEALEPVRRVLTTYIETANSFLTNKYVELTLPTGTTIHGYRDQVLNPAMLSSGEKQLILLLSNTILARDNPGLFLIDEPELSLNVKWQRRLIDALLECAKGANIQYLLASHSLELITLHRDNATQLTPAEGWLIA